jgi:hyperosmotically inducible periplasmic protein
VAVAGDIHGGAVNARRPIIMKVFTQTKEGLMHSSKWVVLVTLLLLIAGVGCSRNQSLDVKDSVKKSLEQGGLNDVKVDQDRDSGVVTLGGQVKSDDEKAHAETIAKTVAGNQVVSNQIAVRPVGFESEAKEIASDLDAGIENNFHAALISNRMDKDINCEAKNGVLTLTGEVNTQDNRDQLEKLAASILNVKQVVNQTQVKRQKATTTP